MLRAVTGAGGVSGAPPAPERSRGVHTHWIGIPLPDRTHNAGGLRGCWRQGPDPCRKLAAGSSATFHPSLGGSATFHPSLGCAAGDSATSPWEDTRAGRSLAGETGGGAQPSGLDVTCVLGWAGVGRRASKPGSGGSRRLPAGGCRGSARPARPRRGQGNRASGGREWQL